ncbi:amidohydrolase family protein [Psychrobacillus vulpis]|uniref:Amidohydrolase family protein n=1 Tax=Psychrobacillus vulpis TaxID=2325572 RepID=A0A544TS74_9BACI|nr:amidohydrolase family protein [Psychrobacillus vulpis]TQR20298.1 amidohydrolase family protein [Psychrobacillus vulpis]
MTGYLVRGKKIVTVSQVGTITDGAMIIENGKITAVDKWENLREQYSYIPVIDYSQYVITPSLVDCHTHLLEFAPTSLYPVTSETHFLAGKSIIFLALSSGITALGEQICGHPLCNFSIEDYRKAVQDLPIDISFAPTSISIGFDILAHFTSITKSQSVTKRELIEANLVGKIARESDYPGENIFINATPANFTQEVVPRAGEIIYSLKELKQITEVYHQLGAQIGAHVAGEEGIEMALEAGIDVFHHAHGISNEQIEKVSSKGVKIVATPMGGTHLRPNSPEEILQFVEKNILVSIATDAYLPPYLGASWLPFNNQSLKGPDVLMLIAHPAMQLLKKHNYDENKILALLTANPANVLGKEHRFGRLEQGLDANFLVAEGIPGLEITEVEKIKKVFYLGKKVIDRKG